MSIWSRSNPNQIPQSTIVDIEQPGRIEKIGSVVGKGARAVVGPVGNFFSDLSSAVTTYRCKRLQRRLSSNEQLADAAREVINETGSRMR